MKKDYQVIHHRMKSRKKNQIRILKIIKIKKINLKVVHKVLIHVFQAILVTMNYKKN
jgi:hypothetical protein